MRGIGIVVADAKGVERPLLRRREGQCPSSAASHLMTRDVLLTRVPPQQRPSSSSLLIKASPHIAAQERRAWFEDIAREAHTVG